MKTMKILGILMMMFAAFSIASCRSDDDVYSPAYRSAISNGVKMSLTDANGNNLVNSGEDLSKIIVHGNLSGKDVPTSVVEVNGAKFVSFNADLPDESKMEYNAEKTFGTGISTMALTIGGQTVNLLFTFEASDSDATESTIGKNSIRIMSIRLGDNVVTRDGNEVGSDIILPILKTKDDILVNWQGE